MHCYEELTLDDMLADPLIEAMMRADGVDADALRPALGEIADIVAARAD